MTHWTWASRHDRSKYRYLCKWKDVADETAVADCVTCLRCLMSYGGEFPWNVGDYNHKLKGGIHE